MKAVNGSVWIPPHVGIPRIEKAVKLANAAHRFMSPSSCPPDLRRPYCDVSSLFEMWDEPKFLPFVSPCVFLAFHQATSYSDSTASPTPSEDRRLVLRGWGSSVSSLS